MLNENDIDFLLMALDKVPLTGIKSSMKLNEVFIKLANWKKALKGNEPQLKGDATVPPIKPTGAIKVSEDEKVVSE